ncbi:primase homolog protein-like [Miscanthus floridulus]|uniref:primase homolog protein-like n=1 Tax=Miscanthus floridulus TaxID=154761 RepID=UPI00345AAE34
MAWAAPPPVCAATAPTGPVVAASCHDAAPACPAASRGAWLPPGAAESSDFVVVLSLQDKKYNYLWNCKDYLDSASRIILATDDDHPGQALAEELARRLGKERCWRVKWPKKNDTDTCKDANEVLMFLGPQALRKVIEDA